MSATRRPPIAAGEHDPAAAQPSPVDAGAEPSPAAAARARARPRGTDRIELGAELRRLREAAGLSGYELGKQTGIARSHLHYLERGKRRLSLDVLERLVGPLVAAQPEPVDVAAVVGRLFDLAGPGVLKERPARPALAGRVVTRRVVRGLQDAAACGLLAPDAGDELAGLQVQLRALWERHHDEPWSQEAVDAALLAAVSGSDELSAYVDALEPVDFSDLFGPDDVIGAG